MKLKSVILLLVSLASVGSGVDAADKPAEKAKPRPPRKADPAFAVVKDDPALPRVLLIGDSISIGYTVPVRELLAGKANVHRIPENGGPTINGLAKLDSWLGSGKWDVIHFNWGLHDIRQDDGKNQQVKIGDYEKNLTELVTRLKASGAKLIWCSTTPVPKGADRREPGDEVQYNAVAKKIMDAGGIMIDDLYAFALPLEEKIQRPANVHYTDEGSKVLAEKVAASILEALGKK
jgi:acyl-CoA thioesterase-1